MSDSKTIFISSTYEDLADHRKKVWDVLDQYKVNVRGMEQFGARKEAALETCLAEVGLSDIYVGIIAYRRGSIESRTRKSFTELEYEKAREADKDIRIYIIDDENATVAGKHVDKGAAGEALDAFKGLLRERHTVDTFVDADDLAAKLKRDLGSSLALKEIGEDTGESFDESLQLLEEFLLVPRALAGREVLIEIEFKSMPFAASRDICRAFNFKFGATVGATIVVRQPPGFDRSGLSLMFFDAKQRGEVMPWKVGEKRKIYANLLFVDKAIDQVETRFKPESEVIIPTSLTSMTAIAGSVQNLFEPKTIHHDAEGKVVLAFNSNVSGQTE